MMCQVTPTSSVPHQFVERLVDWKIVPSLFCYEVCFSVAKELGWGPFSNIFEIGRTVKKEFFLKIINCLRPRLGSGSLKYFHFHLNNDQIHSPCKSTPKLVHSTGGASLLLWWRPVVRRRRGRPSQRHRVRPPDWRKKNNSVRVYLFPVGNFRTKQKEELINVSVKDSSSSYIKYGHVWNRVMFSWETWWWWLNQNDSSYRLEPNGL